MHAFLKTLAANDHLFRLLCLYGGILGGAFYLLTSLGGTLAPFIIGLLGAYILSHPLNYLTRIGLSRGIAAFLIVFILVIGLVILTGIAFPYIQRELSVLASNLPDIAQNVIYHLSPAFDKLTGTIPGDEIKQIKAQLSGYFGELLKWLIQLFIGFITNGLLLANVLSLVILTPVIMFYLLKDWNKLTHFLNPILQKSKWSLFLVEIDKSLMAYLSGQALVSLILMVVYSVSLGLSGLNHGFTLGLMTGLLSFIPYLGSLAGLFICMAVAFSQYTDWKGIVTILSVIIIIWTIEGNYLTPRLIGDKVGLHPVLLLFSILAAAQWYGLIGVVCALPIAACLVATIKVIRQL